MMPTTYKHMPTPVPYGDRAAEPRIYRVLEQRDSRRNVFPKTGGESPPVPNFLVQPHASMRLIE